MSFDAKYEQQSVCKDMRADDVRVACALQLVRGGGRRVAKTNKDIMCCKYTEDVKDVAAGFTDGTIRLFDCTSGTNTHTLVDEECKSYPGPVTAIKHRPVSKAHPITNMLLSCSTSKGRRSPLSTACGVSGLKSHGRILCTRSWATENVYIIYIFGRPAPRASAADSAFSRLKPRSDRPWTYPQHGHYRVRLGIPFPFCSKYGVPSLVNPSDKSLSGQEAARNKSNTPIHRITVYCTSTHKESTEGVSTDSLKHKEESSEEIVKAPRKNIVDGHTSRIFACAFNPKSHHELISGGWDNNVICWDDRQPYATRHIFGVHICGEGLDFDKPGKQILTCAWQDKKSIQLWDYGSCKLIETIEPDNHQSKLYCGKFVPRTNLIVCGGSDANTFRVVDINLKITECSIRNNPGGIYAFDFGTIRRKPRKVPETYKRISEIDSIPRVVFVTGKRLQTIDFG
ncbi:unnamed protein product [Chilo suppressalis]|uniref:Uncharacterized protein n=1 Tax=Chilo suppressalis TaxID=168631 RepID=A0ABN8BG49_CHISP|nr:unnamed protein product [Chilo suppressalis]